MKLSYCCVVRDDTDILPFNVLHYYNLGIRHFYFLLHKPDAALYATIGKLESKLKDAFIWHTSRFDDSHYHEKDVKTLTDKASDDGCDWFIPSDSDEIIILKKHKTLQEFLEQYQDKRLPELSLLFKWADYLPTRECNQEENPFTAYSHYTGYREQTKCIAYFPKSILHFVAGVHMVYGSRNIINIDPSIAYYVHVPDRTIDQFEKKYLIQNKNWLSRYGSFPISEQIAKDPNFLKDFWEVKRVKDTTGMICEPVPDTTFEWPVLK